MVRFSVSFLRRTKTSEGVENFSLRTDIFAATIADSAKINAAGGMLPMMGQQTRMESLLPLSLRRPDSRRPLLSSGEDHFLRLIDRHVDLSFRPGMSEELLQFDRSPLD
jgi:hypothetical protein